MRHVVTALVLALCGAPAVAGDVAVSVSVGEPGFYGQIEIGNMPRPAVVYTQPVVVERAPEYHEVAPIYLHVPPGHEKHWSKHCREYGACGRPVYFVKDEWYNNEYVQHYKRAEHAHADDREGDHDHGEHKGHHHDEDRRDRND